MEKAFRSAAGADDDEHLMQRVAQGDRPAFAALYDRFSTPLYSLALKMLGNETEAQDLLHEIFLSIWSKAKAFRVDRGSAFSWVVSHLRNRAAERLRSRRRLNAWNETSAPAAEPENTATTFPAKDSEINEETRRVRAALTDLPEEQLQILRMAFFEGMSQVEIAQKLEEPLTTIKAQAHRGMAQLRIALRFLHG